jgi:integrase
MTRLHLKYVQSFGGYHYFRRRGQTRVRLPGIVGSAEFMAAYQEALATPPTPIGKSLRSKPGSVSAAIAEYLQSQAWRSLTGGTPRIRRPMLESFRQKHGHLALASLPKEFIVALLDTLQPHAARNWIKTLRHFTSWCVERKLMKNDPTFGVRIKLPKSDGHHTWAEDEIAQFEARHAIGSKPRLALALGLYTAQRREDVVLIGRQHLKNGVLMVRPLKTRNTTNVTLTIPVHPTLQTTIDATPTGHMTLLTTKNGNAYDPDHFSHQFRIWCDAAGLPQHCTFHGLRKLALTRLAAVGCTVHEIAAISGHSSLKEVERYTRAFDRARLARSAMAKTAAEENKSGLESVKQQPAEVSKPLTELPKKAG